MVKISSDIPVSADQKEVLAALKPVEKEYGPIRRLVEVGSLNGFNFNTLVRVLQPELAVSVDMQGASDGKAGTKVYLDKVITSLRSDGFRIEQVTGDSHAPEVYRKVRDWGPFDLAYIDGDHTYTGAQLDLQDYPARVTLFHDIVNANFGVSRFWQDLKRDYRTDEFTFNLEPRRHLGVGVLHDFHQR